MFINRFIFVVIVKMFVKQKSILSKVIKDLEAEIISLNKERDTLKKSLEKTTLDISDNKQKELALQKVLANLEEKEAKLLEHKKELQSESNMVSDKLGKMSKIKSEMKNI